MTQSTSSSGRLVALPLVALIAALLVSYCWIAVFATNATAAIVGDDLSHAPDSWQYGTIVTPARNMDLAGSPYSGFASAGVLTSVSIRTQGDAADITVLLLRKTGEPGPGTVTMLSVAPSITIGVTADATSTGHVTTVLTRRPVQAGDRFGATTAISGTRFLWWYNALEFDYCYYNDSGHADGTTANYLSPSCNNYVPLVQGTVEPDADGDGYGDETQDLCATDAALQTACPPPPAPPAPPAPLSADLALTAVKAGKSRLGRSATRAFMITNNGPDAAALVVLKIARNSKFKSSVILKGACIPSTDKRSCTLTSLAPGASVTVKVRALARRSRRSSISASVTSGTADPNTANNSVSATAKFKL